MRSNLGKDCCNSSIVQGIYELENLLYYMHNITSVRKYALYNYGSIWMVLNFLRTLSDFLERVHILVISRMFWKTHWTVIPVARFVSTGDGTQGLPPAKQTLCTELHLEPCSISYCGPVVPHCGKLASLSWLLQFHSPCDFCSTS